MKKQILLPPTLFRDWDYRPPSPRAVRNKPFICKRTDQSQCTLSLCGEEHFNLTLAEYLNACDILMFDLDVCEHYFSRLAIGGIHMMQLTKKEANYVLQYLRARQRFSA